MKLKDFIDFIKDAVIFEDKYIYVLIENNELIKPEIIINNHENFKSKMHYYENAYDEDLVLKTNKNIKIIDYGIINSYCDIERLFSDLK